MIVVVDTKKFAPIRVQDKNGNWWTIKGKCKRCGKCGCVVSKCVHFTREKIDGVNIGKCLRQFEKPFMCVLYPFDPLKPLPKGCGFEFVKE
jgi:hypothetical protein